MGKTTRRGNCDWCGAWAAHLWKAAGVPYQLCRKDYTDAILYGHPSCKGWLELRTGRDSVVKAWRGRLMRWQSKDSHYAPRKRHAYQAFYSKIDEVVERELSRDKPRFASRYVLGVFAGLTRSEKNNIAARYTQSIAWLFSDDPCPVGAKKTLEHLDASLVAWLLRKGNARGKVSPLWDKRKVSEVFLGLRAIVGELRQALFPLITLIARKSSVGVYQGRAPRRHSCDGVKQMPLPWHYRGERRVAFWVPRFSKADMRARLSG